MCAISVVFLDQLVAVNTMQCLRCMFTTALWSMHQQVFELVNNTQTLAQAIAHAYSAV